MIILKVMLISWLITNYDPIKWIFDIFRPKNRIVSLIYNIVQLAFTCLKCCSLYIGWIMGGLYIGITCSFIGYLYDSMIIKINKR